MKRPYFIYGPQKNRTRMLNKLAFFIRRWQKKVIIQKVSRSLLVGSSTNLGPIKCIEWSLYDYKNDGNFTQWLVKNFYSKDEQSVHFIEAILIMEEPSDSLCWNMAILIDDMEEKKTF